ncbi:PREDICTED: receptor-type tyrosine-protein phosphatase F [Eufriesea mexicana]|uniref:receptor-type tyrosine-protein phosphatase F n=1 Tax=Eufriesea mexicana TaxID=516756 RepID=UPI00083C0B75|nr:PREDICTED: receptor-type tyrosine-protein phosphatase F [Eufriesea mexicana]
MIEKKQMKILIYALHTIYVFGENNLINTERNEIMNTSNEILAYDYAKYAVSSKINNSFLKSFRKIDEFRNEMIEYNQNQLLLDDYLKSNNTNILILDTTINDIVQKFEHIFNTSDELTNQILLKNDSLTCYEIDRRNVRNLTVELAGTEWIFLSWQPPCENATSVLFIYTIDICLEQQCSPKNITIQNDTQYNVTGLDPCKEYKFIVKIIDNEFESDGVSVIGTTIYNITEIKDIRELVAHTTINTITLNWKPPENYSTCITNYLITQCFKDTCNNVRVTHEEYVSKDLEPCEKYFFIIKVASYLIQSNGFNITLKTNSPKSSKPLYPTVEASAFSLFIHWQPPEVGARCIKFYRITIDPQSTTKEITGTNVTINDLNACTPYFVYINAVDEDNNDGEMVTMETRTAPTVSRPPILNTKEPIVTINDIMLSWKIEKGNNNCILKSLKAICNSTATSGHGYEIKNGKAEVVIDSRIQDEYLIINSVIKNISPFTTYICWAYVVNEAGNSELSNLISVTTLEDIPSAPPFSVINITYSQFIFVWELPMYLAGNVHEFKIVFEGEICFPVPDWCKQIALKTIKCINGSTFTFEYLEAKAYTNYKAKIKARTTAGWGNYSNDLIFQTPVGVPGIVSNFSYLIANNKNNTNILDTILTWGIPCSLNGILEYFNVLVNGTRTNYSPHAFTIKKYISDNVIRNNIVSINLKELKAEYNYTFKVSAKVQGVDEFGIPACQHVLYPAGIPFQPDKDYIKFITIDPANARRSTTSATLLLPLFPNVNGDIVYYSIIVSRTEYNIPSSIRFDIMNHTWPNISSWEEAMVQDFIIPYQATRLWWDPYPNYVADYGDVKAVKYTLGEDTNCKEISSNTNKRIYCNGPLKPNTWYHVRMRAFTRGGYSDSTAFLIKTNSEINIALASGVVFGILFMGILTTMMLLIRKCSLYVILRRFLHSDMSGSPVPASFSKKKFIAHCQQLIDNPGKLSNEFQLLQTLSVDLQMPTNTACLQANKKKNRYSDILPYDFSRVKLEVIDNDPNTDYINASFIKGYSGEDEYIACQGPKEETTFDFWRMIEQYNINLIVMLTELVEKGKEKCHQYFPTIRETFKYENMTIKCISELDFRSYTQRTLILQKESNKRNIIHLHFKEWPDHDVPEDFDPMIHFCQIVRRNATANKGYIIIHCSAGIGRTGTLIAIDIILQHLRDNRKLDVFGTVYRLRHHRINMVQKESQYAYIYNCIKQVLKNPYCLKSYKPPPMDPMYENTSKRIKIVPTSNIDL